MTSLVATKSVTVVDEINSVISVDTNCNFHKHRHRRHVLKSKENKIKDKCIKVLRRKLKKYKLRQDGREDPDVVDVSKILVSSLSIKSPNKNNLGLQSEGELSDFEDFRPKNYLINMVRRKEALKLGEGLKYSDTEVSMPSINPTQVKKHTNAFQLLMDSRNKSIGSNSPGKDKNDDDANIQEVVERKSIKAKRQLLLLKMAEAKGSIKNKQIEEEQNMVIKEKMEKRAEKLKSMIFKDTKSIKENEFTSKKTLKKANDKKIISKDHIETKTSTDLKITSKDKVKTVNNNHHSKQTKTLKIVDIFNTIEDPINVSPEKKLIPKEDQEFLSKLSPSLKKKESMLCYFKKLDKDSLDSSSVDVENHNLIKVKLQPRNKKRGKKKKLSLKRDDLDSDDTVVDVVDITKKIDVKSENDKDTIVEEKAKSTSITSDHNSESALVEVSTLNDNMINENLEVRSERLKRKRTSKVNAKIDTLENHNAVFINESRPKRSVKRPVKYNDDACLSSSDEELHIFTPKKKKHVETGPSDNIEVDIKPNKVDELVKAKSEKKMQKDSSKKPTKLAPIFTSKTTDLAALEAKHKFLQSGVPEKLKKNMNQQKNSSIPNINFPVVCHVQQIHKIQKTTELCVALMEVNEEFSSLTNKETGFKKLLSLDDAVCSYDVDKNLRGNTQTVLQSIKQLHPNFPVYRTYRYLRGKRKGEFKDCNYVDVDNSIEIMTDVVDVVNDNSPDRLNWTDKYKATSTKDIIGNFESVKELRKWLVSWTENDQKAKSKPKSDSDSSDYYQSDTDSRDSVKTMNNLLIVTGPTGCGKTASVYTVAAELAMKVIEVNASSRRTGKIMLQDLQEATQSHKVNRGTGNSDNIQKSQETKQPDISKQIKKRGRPKKSMEDEKTKRQPVKTKTEVLSGSSQSQEVTRTDSSLILIDDADIVFDQDDGFSSAIMQLVQCSKRPVILITSSLVCPHLQRFLQNGKVLKMYPLSPRILGTWLDIMCLADSGICWPGAGAKFLNYFKGDIRKTINYLQFWIPIYVRGTTTPDEETSSQNVDFYKTNIDDESSCMSWADNYDTEVRTLVSLDSQNIHLEQNTIWTDFVEKHFNIFKSTSPVQLFNIWWSVPHLLSITPVDNSVNKLDVHSQFMNGKVKQELEAIANAIDAISLSDYISHINPNANLYITSEPWYYPEGHSVSEKENFDYYLREHEVTDEICHNLVTSSISAAQDILGCDKKMDSQFPGMTMQRERDKIVSRHKSLSGFLNASAVLDRRAVALDYWPACRSICRFEKSKNDTNLKRNNRFCHYLKSLSVLCKSDTFDNLCDSLCSNEKLNET